MTKKHETEGQDHDEAEAGEFYRAHGYPHGTPDREWLEQMLHATEQRLVKLSATRAPAVILENERRIIATRKTWLLAWDKEKKA